MIHQAGKPSAERPSADALTFGPFELKMGQRLLLRDGQPVGVGDRALDLLIALADADGAVLDKRYLIATVWNGMAVSEGNLRTQIGLLRKWLGETQTGPRYIANVAGQGYSFVAPVKRIAAPPPRLGTPAVALSKPPPVSDHGVFGRADAVKTVLEALQTERVVALVGSGGIGKTTVAKAVVQSAVAAFPDGIAWIDLAYVGDPLLVPRAIATALGSGGNAGDPVPSILMSLRDRRALLVLDCCERVLDGAARMAERITEALPGITILATSRERLRTRRECVVRLAPLPTPADGADLSLDAAADSPAVQLFLARAHSAGAPLVLGPDNARVIADLCRRLDGIPLALELAASQMLAFSPADLLALIDHGEEGWGLGPRTAEPRHLTMRATLDWSHDLLAEEDRTVFRRLAIFEGGVSLPAAMDMVAFADLPGEAVARALSSLVEKSLVSLESGRGHAVYRMADTTRHYALLQLAAHDEHSIVAARHATDLMRRLAGAGIEGAPEEAAAWFGPQYPNLDNLRAALRWTLSEEAHAPLAVELAQAAAPVFMQLSLLQDCEDWCTRIQPLAARGVGPQARLAEMRLLAYQGAAMLGTRGPVDASLHALTRARTLAEGASAGGYLFLVLSALFWFWIYRGDINQAIACAELMRWGDHEAPDTGGWQVADQSIAIASTLHGDQTQAERHLKKVLSAEARLRLGRYMRIGSCPGSFSNVFLMQCYWLQGRFSEAHALFDLSAPELRAPEHGLYYCWALNEVMIPLLCFQGRLEEAAEQARELQRAADLLGLSARRKAAACISLAIAVLGGSGDPRAFARMLDGLRQDHLMLQLPWFETVLAEALGRNGDAADGIPRIDAAIADCNRTGNGWWLPELHRVRGQLYLCRSDRQLRQQGLHDLDRAYGLAGDQGALALQASALGALAQAPEAHAEFLALRQEELLHRIACIPAADDRRWLSGCIRVGSGGTAA